MTKATKPQITKIHILLNSLGLMDEKADMILNLSEGRTTSSKELTIEEARLFISSLAQYDPNERLKSLIFSLAYRAGIIYGDTPDDKKMNAAKLDLFLKERGAVKKPLNALNYKELIKTHRQFEAIAKSVSNAKDNKAATAAVKSLLTELDITHTA